MRNAIRAQTEGGRVEKRGGRGKKMTERNGRKEPASARIRITETMDGRKGDPSSLMQRGFAAKKECLFEMGGHRRNSIIEGCNERGQGLDQEKSGRRRLMGRPRNCLDRETGRE
ncbi:hypothetical protein Trydic_g16934 [Trypoxylus dichotomus]